MANGTSTMEIKALRQQLREQLEAGIRQTEAVIQQYRELYPNFDQMAVLEAEASDADGGRLGAADDGILARGAGGAGA